MLLHFLSSIFFNEILRAIFVFHGLLPTKLDYYLTKKYWSTSKLCFLDKYFKQQVNLTPTTTTWQEFWYLKSTYVQV